MASRFDDYMRTAHSGGSDRSPRKPHKLFTYLTLMAEHSATNGVVVAVDDDVGGNLRDAKVLVTLVESPSSP